MRLTDLPQEDRAIVADAGESVSIWGERYRSNISCMSRECGKVCCCFRVPQLRCFIITASRYFGAIMRIDYGIDSVCMS